MTREQKAALAEALIVQAGNLVEFWGEQHDTRALAEAGVTREEAARVLAAWMRKLPGTAWDTRLPEES